MKSSLKLYAQIFAKSSFKFVLLLTLGSILCVVCTLLALLQFSAQESGGMANAGHASSGMAAIFLTIVLFSVDFWASLLLLSSLLVFPVVYFILAQKIAVHTAVYLMCKNQLSDWIKPKMEDLFLKLENKQPGWMKTASDGALLKLKLAEANRQDPETPKLQKRALGYMLSKASLEDIDFRQDKLSLSSILSQKVYMVLDDAAQPSSSLFWLAAAAQLAILIASFTL